MKIFKKIAACLMACVLMVSGLVTTASAESIEDIAKKMESGKTYKTELADNGKLAYKMKVSKAGSLTISTTFYTESIGFKLFDKVGNEVACDDVKLSKGSRDGGWSKSYVVVQWAETFEKGVVTLTYNIEEKGTYYLQINHRFGNTNNISISATFPSETVTTTTKTPYLSLTLAKGDAIMLGTTVDGATWSSSDKTVASVSSKGKIKAKKAGTVFITAKVNNIKLKIQIKVTE